MLLAGLWCATSCGLAPPGSVDPPENFEDVILAEGLWRLGDPAAALALAETRTEGETALWAHRVVQDSLVALGRVREAHARYEELADLYPDDPMFSYLAGRIALPDAEQARPLFERALEADPDFAWGHIGLARIEILRGDKFQAIVAHREQLERRPDDPDLQMSFGFLCLDLRLLRDATRAFQQGAALRGWDPRILGGLGQALGQLENDEESLLYLRRALDIDPSRTDLMAAESFVLYRAGRYDEAWEVMARQQAVDGSVDPLLAWKLELQLEREIPQVAILGPLHLRRAAGTP